MTKEVNIHEWINEVTLNTAYQYKSIRIKCLLQERLDERGLNLRELSLLTGIRYATLHEFKTSKKATINVQHTLAIMVALRLKAFNELFELTFEDKAEEEVYNNEWLQYKKYGVPDTSLQQIKENAKKLNRIDELRKK